MFKALIPVYHSTVCSRVIKKKSEEGWGVQFHQDSCLFTRLECPWTSRSTEEVRG